MTRKDVVTRVRKGMKLPTNSGDFKVIEVGDGTAHLHPPTNAMLPEGTVLRNPAGWHGSYEWNEEAEQADWSWWRGDEEDDADGPSS